MQIFGKFLKRNRQGDRPASNPQAPASIATSEPAPAAETSLQERLRSDLQTSEASDQNMAEWWEVAHREKREFWLTGSRGPEVWDYLNITQRVQPDQVVLNIGVGLGYCTRALAEHG